MMIAASPSTPEARLAALDLTLPPLPRPVATYVTHVRHGSLIFLSGQGPRDHTGVLQTGKVGSDIDIAEGYARARLTGLNLLAILHGALGDLSRVAGVVKVLGMVNAAPDFRAHPKVIDGCSDLLVAVFGDAGRHARSAVGMGSLPDDISVEIEAIFAIAD